MMGVQFTIVQLTVFTCVNFVVHEKYFGTAFGLI
jgi:hypothetical protein